MLVLCPKPLRPRSIRAQQAPNTRTQDIAEHHCKNTRRPNTPNTTVKPPAEHANTPNTPEPAFRRAEHANTARTQRSPNTAASEHTGQFTPHRASFTLALQEHPRSANTEHTEHAFRPLRTQRSTNTAISEHRTPNTPNTRSQPAKICIFNA